MSKFLTYEERLEIAKCLKENLSFGEIGKRIEKDRTTIAKEVKKHSYDKKSGYSSYPYNACRRRMVCKVKNICPKDNCTRSSTTYCKLCSQCNDKCPDFMEDICTARFKAPYVCNGCSQLGKCTLKKLIYDPEDAHIASAEQISESRSGILSNEVELARINSIISPLIKNGQSVHQVYESHVDEIMCSEKTLYNYIDACLFDVRNIDLPRKVKYRPRYKKPEFKVDKGCRIGRNYDDFKSFMERYPDIPVVQMDSVIGGRGGKVLLTIHFVETSLMLAFIRDANTSQSVIDIFELLYKTLGKENFQKLFPVILTDNGSEFSNPKEIEFGISGRRTYIFYCDASSPYQKGSIEVNHELIRRILPKGTSFDTLSQEDIARMMNHINSYKRKKLNNRTPYEAFSFYYGEELLKKLGCSSVAAENIILKPKLLKK
jgi:transposase, IS30 family